MTAANSPPSRPGRIVPSAQRARCCVALSRTDSKPCFAPRATGSGAALDQLLERSTRTVCLPLDVGLASNDDCR